MVPDDFIDFFVASAGATGALVGLLFVAVSLAPRRLRDPATAHVAQTQAAAALLTFTNTLALGLLALFPDTNIGWGAFFFAAVGMIYSLSVARIAAARRTVDKSVASKLARVALGTFVITGLQGFAGLRLMLHPGVDGALYMLAATMISAVLFGISRAWELVGLHDTGLFQSLRVLRDPERADLTSGPEDPSPT